MHINRGDDRQYFEKEAEYDYSGAYAGMFNKALNQGVSITQKANESTLANNQIDLSARFLSVNNDINTKYQVDPTNPQREVELKQAFDSLASEYKINPVSEVQWNNIKNNVYNRYKTYNAQWSEKQQQSNISTNLENGYKTLNDQISMLGMNGAGIDEVRLVYDNGIEGLRNGSVAKLGEVFVDNALKDANHDLMTTYISSLAMNNPLEAQRLLQDEGVRNDIGRAETLEKLEKYTATSLTNQNKKVAVNELGNTLRNMNTEEAHNIINGKADLTTTMKFIENNKNIPEGSKDLILGIYGIGSSTDYYYNRDKKIIEKKETTSSGGSGSTGLVSLKKLPQIEKDGMTADLEAHLYDMFSFEETESVKPKKAVKKGEAVETQNNVLDKMKLVAQAQGTIDTFYSTGVIDKPTRQRLMNQFIEPMTNYLEASMEGLDEKAHFLGPKLGYGALKQEFNIENIPANQTKNIKATQKSLLTAQGYYYNALDNARRKLNLNSIYDLENLSNDDQKRIYKQASTDAINAAKKYGEYPEVFFQREYPETYNQPFLMFKENQAIDINKAVAKTLYQTDIADKDKNDFVNQIMAKEINNQAYKNRMDSAKTLGLTPDVNSSMHSPLPKTKAELEEKLSDMGYTLKDFRNFAVEYGYVTPQEDRKRTTNVGINVLASNPTDNFNNYLSNGYIKAYKDIRYAKARQNKKGNK